MKTYRANPADHDAVAKALLEKYRDSQPAVVGDPHAGCTVELEDHGQDFLEFDIKGGVIVDTRPFQGFVWDGRKVLNTKIGVGDYIDLSGLVGVIRYPVIDVKPLEAVKA